MESEIDLVRRAQKGDRSAFEELVRRMSRFVYARLYLDTGDPHRAEDLVQETFMRAFRSIGRLNDPAGFRTWLATMSQSALIDSIRRAGRQKRAAPPMAGSDALGAVAAPAERPGVDAMREKVRALLQSLPEAYRLPLALRYIDGADNETITMQLGLSNGSLRGLFQRGLKLLRGALKTEAKP